jgi:hypothetical protein
LKLENAEAAAATHETNIINAGKKASADLEAAEE